MIPYDPAALPKFTYHTKGRKEKVKVCDNIVCFDIETSSYFYDDSGHVRTYRGIEKSYKNVPDPKERYKKINDLITYLHKGNVCYIWQLGVDDVRFYGRTLQEFKEAFTDLCQRIDTPFICWVHNLAYEYQTLRGVFGDDNIEAFYTEARKPLYVKWRNAEFRCSYRLTNSSLEQWGHKLGIEKLDTLDYGKLYTPKSEIPQEALAYAERDIEIMEVGIRQYVTFYGNLWKIPLTQTGQVRGEIKSIYHDDYNYHHRITDMQPRNNDEYKVERWAYMGGFCATNVRNAGKIIKKPGSYDRGSAYPFQLVTRPFPASRFRECHVREEDFDFDLNHYIFYAEISNVVSKSSIHCMPMSKIFNKVGNGRYDNGKLIDFNGFFEMFLTEVDLDIYRTYYDFYIYYKKVWVATSRLLDIKLVKYVLELYAGKTTLKGVVGEEHEYMRKKQLLNSVYGCCCTSLVFPETSLVDNEWIEEEPTEDRVNEELLKLQKNMWKNNLAYSTGIYVTAYQRRDLLKTVAKISEKDFCYTDTDSIKMKHPEKYADLFEEENAAIRARIEQIAEHRGIDMSMYEPEDQKGNKHLIGIWENEGMYDRAVFLGAKRYCYEQDGHTNVVVSGVPKIASEGFNLEDFKDGLLFTPEKCGYKKNILAYLDGNNGPVTLKKGKPDEWTVDQTHGICMWPTGYDMSLSKDYSNLIELYKIKDGIPI